jgi:hypothetical protein
MSCKVSKNQCVQFKMQRAKDTISTVKLTIITMPKASDSALNLWLMGIIVFIK